MSQMNQADEIYSGIIAYGQNSTPGGASSIEKKENVEQLRNMICPAGLIKVYQLA